MFLRNDTMDTMDTMTTTTLMTLMTDLLSKYDRVVVLDIFVDSEDDQLKYLYATAAEKHNTAMRENAAFIDAGFDLFAPFGPVCQQLTALDYGICCAAKMHTDTGKCYNTGYYMHPRSSLSKTPLRLANSTGIVDAGYRGHLIGMFDMHGTTTAWGNIYDRYLQICAPGLVPMIVRVVKTKDALGENTERGDRGLGSSGR